MTEDQREALADQIAKEITETLECHPRILGFRGLGHRGMHDIENEIYGFLMDHATFTDERDEDLPSLEDVKGILA